MRADPMKYQTGFFLKGAISSSLNPNRGLPKPLLIILSRPKPSNHRPKTSPDSRMYFIFL